MVAKSLLVQKAEALTGRSSDYDVGLRNLGSASSHFSMLRQTTMPPKLEWCVAIEERSLSTAKTHLNPPQKRGSTKPNVMPPAPQNKSIIL